MRALPAVLIAAMTLGACGRDAPQSEEPETPAAAPDLVELDSAQVANANLGLGPAGSMPPDTIVLTGTITFDAGRVSHVGPRIQGRIREVTVDLGASVKTGEVLAVLDSPELAAAQARWAQARIRRDLAARNYERADRLSRDGIVSGRRLLEAEAELRDRDAELAGARQTLSALGAEADTAATGIFVLRAPLSGELVERHAVPGEVVGPETSLFVVGELERVWLLLDMYDRDLTRVRVGAAVRVTPEALPDHPVLARIGLISPLVDTLTRTVRVRVEIPNNDHQLKPGMFARAAVTIPGTPDAIGVPREAVQLVNDRTVVFVPEGPGRFRVRPVVLRDSKTGTWVEVQSGLVLGDTVVVGGSFSLKAHLLRAAFGGGEQ